MNFREWLLAERGRHADAIRRIDEQLARMGVELPKRTPAACVEMLRLAGAPLSAVEVIAELRDHGHAVEDNAVAQALSRLARAGAIARPSHGRYAYIASDAALAG